MIQAAQTQDLDDIAAMWMHVCRQEFVHYLGQDVVEFFIESGELREEVACCSDSTYVYREDNRVLGFVVLQQDLIELMVVRSDCQNQSIGKQLYEYSIALISKHHRHVRAECSEQDEKSNGLLRNQGFDFIGRYEDEMGFVRRQYSKPLI
jgi:ribosomal protein S18 acetylase RimI-like enzyme